MREHIAQKIGDAGPREAVEACLERVDASESDVHAFVTFDAAAARDAADAAARRSAVGRPLSPLDGRVIGVKDVFETVDFPTACGSPIFDSFQARRDAAAVAALRRAGAIVLGKTVTTEFAVGAAGPTRNPIDLARSPGGSSSGSAAAVAAGMVEFALGTQTQSSTLRPASYCGVVGFKPSFGWVPLGGVHPLAPSMDSFGVLAPSVASAWGAAMTAGGATPETPAACRPARLGLVMIAGASDVAVNAFDTAVRTLKGLGVEIVEGAATAPIATAFAAAGSVSDAILPYEMGWPFGAYLDVVPDQLGQRVRSLTEIGRAMESAAYQAALDPRRDGVALLDAIAGRLDGLICLAAPGPAPLGRETNGPPPGAREFCIPASLFGAPAMSLPLLEADGLPLGLQAIAPPGRDAELASLCLWLERALGGRGDEPDSDTARRHRTEGD